VKKFIQNGKGELFFNAANLLNTMVIKKTDSRCWFPLYKRWLLRNI